MLENRVGSMIVVVRHISIPPSLVLSVPIMMETTSLELMEYIANLLFRLRQLLEQRPNFSVEGPSTKKGSFGLSHVRLKLHFTCHAQRVTIVCY
jgi:hypothetical protein